VPVSTPVLLTVTDFGTKISSPLCYFCQFFGWRTQSFPVRMGPSPGNGLEDNARAVRFLSPLAPLWATEAASVRKNL